MCARVCVWAVPGRLTVQQSTWDHPCDNYYRDLYEEEKKKRGGSARGNQATGEARKAKERAQAKERSSIKAIIGKKKKHKRSKKAEVGANVGKHLSFQALCSTHYSGFEAQLWIRHEAESSANHVQRRTPNSPK